VVVLPALDAIAERGRKSVREMTKLIEKLETAGAKCRSVKEPGLYGQQYAVCYLCSEYSDELPLEVKKIVQYVVSLQTTAIYTHMYYVKGRFENCFSEQARDGVDYLVASEYIANWICEREPAWEEKILRFGYPKLDNLYHAIKSEPDIPEEWKQKIDGKKVFLFTTYEMEQSWLDFFAGEKDKIAIWRPHPLAMENINWRKTAEKIGEKYNIIMDFQLSYYASFRISDAHIGQAITSVNVNYLYTGKPACSYDPGKDEELVIDFRQEAWYKSMYIASEEKDVLQFIKMVERGEDVLSEEQRQCRERVVKHFDGEVCNRIYDYIEGKKERLRESGS
jgi:hypothetical protein